MDKSLFFKSVRAGILGPTLDESEVQGCEAILAAMDGQPLSWTAYVLATAYHETGSLMSPATENLNYSVAGLLKTFGRHRISEADANQYGRSGTRPADQQMIANRIYGGLWGKENLGNHMAGDGWKFIGRGMDQVTGRANYEKVDRELGLGGELLASPTLLLDTPLAARVIASGMIKGRYRKHKLADFLPGDRAPADLNQFARARAIINPDANGRLIGRHAIQFQSALQAAGWGR